jgi:hypothetical protein
VFIKCVTAVFSLTEAEKGGDFQAQPPPQLSSITTNKRKRRKVTNDINNDINNDSFTSTPVPSPVPLPVVNFSVGDAVVFVSHKYHSVTPVLRGRRKVLIVEYWRGASVSCGHRCEDPTGKCTFIDNE